MEINGDLLTDTFCLKRIIVEDECIRLGGLRGAHPPEPPLHPLCFMEIGQLSGQLFPVRKMGE